MLIFLISDLLNIFKSYIMLEINTIPLSKLYKGEEYILLRSVVEILEKHNPEALRLQDMHDLLLLQLDKAEVLSIK